MFFFAFEILIKFNEHIIIFKYYLNMFHSVRRDFETSFFQSLAEFNFQDPNFRHKVLENENNLIFNENYNGHKNISE